MKMIMIICPDARQKDIRALIAKHDVHAFSELKDVTGEGLRAFVLPVEETL